MATAVRIPRCPTASLRYPLPIRIAFVDRLLDVLFTLSASLLLLLFSVLTCCFPHITVVTFYPQAYRVLELFSCNPICCIFTSPTPRSLCSPSYSHTRFGLLLHSPIVCGPQFPILPIILREDAGVTFFIFYSPLSSTLAPFRFNFTFGPPSLYIHTGHQRAFARSTHGLRFLFPVFSF